LKPSSITSTRIGLWLATCLEEQYEAARLGTGDDRYLSEVLDGLLRYGQYTKVSKGIILDTKCGLTSQSHCTLSS
jgi:hypothetical protein